MNGATCVDGTDGYTCYCAPGFTGINCQTGQNLSKKQLCNSNAGNQRNVPAIRATKASQIQPDIDHYFVDRKQK